MGWRQGVRLRLALVKKSRSACWVGRALRETSIRESLGIFSLSPPSTPSPPPTSLGGDQEGRTQRKHLAGSGREVKGGQHAGKWVGACRSGPASLPPHPRPSPLLGSREAAITASLANRGSGGASCSQLRDSCSWPAPPPAPRGWEAPRGSAHVRFYVRAPPEQTRRRGREAGSAALPPSWHYEVPAQVSYLKLVRR